jgi:hypothetical protein
VHGPTHSYFDLQELMDLFDGVTGAVFVVCLIITCRSVLIFPAIYLDDSLSYFSLLTVMFYLSEIN